MTEISEPRPLPMASVRRMVAACLFAALVAIGSQIVIPVGPVPVVLANLFVILAGLVLGPLWGAGAVALYLFVGMMGMPVFSEFRGGLGALVGPTGGYLAGYAAGAFVAGAVAHSGRPSWIRDAAGAAVGMVVIYGLGVPWLKVYLGSDWSRALALGVLPFLPGDSIKVLALVPVARQIRRQAPWIEAP